MLRCSFIVDPRTVTAVFAFLLTVLLCAPAGAQTPAPPPVFPAVDGNSVDVATGAFNYSQTDVVIGQPGAGGLSFTRSYQSGPNAPHNYVGYVITNGTTCSVVLGRRTETFNGCSGTANQQSGSTLSSSGSTYTYTASDGTVAVFIVPYSGPPYYTAYSIEHLPDGAAYLANITTPSGEVTTYYYDSSPTMCWPSEEYCWASYVIMRLHSVGTNLGYRLFFEYPGPIGSGTLVNKVTGINLSIEYCLPGNCAQPWPSATYTYNGNISTTNALGETTTYTYSGNDLVEVQFPDHADHDLNITYASSRVASVDLGFGTWSYAYADASGDRTTTVTHPGGATRRYVSTIATGRIKSVTNELNQTLSYQYDGAARQTRVTQPEGNYTQYAYDSRGNITETRQVSKTPGTYMDASPRSSHRDA